MQRRTSLQEFHRHRQTAALLTAAEADRHAFLDGLLQDTELCDGARRSFLYQLKVRAVPAGVFQQAAEESLSIVLRAAFRRLDALLAWNPSQGELATWWGLQAVFEFNNDGRRGAERSCGYWRGTNEWFAFVPTEHAAADEDTCEVLLVDLTADPAERAERAMVSDILHGLFVRADDPQAVQWLRDWLEAGALHQEEPLKVTPLGPRLVWKYGAQRQAAHQASVSDRTMRTRTRRVESMLSKLLRSPG